MVKKAAVHSLQAMRLLRSKEQLFVVYNVCCGVGVVVGRVGGKGGWEADVLGGTEGREAFVSRQGKPLWISTSTVDFKE